MKINILVLELVGYHGEHFSSKHLGGQGRKVTKLKLGWLTCRDPAPQNVLDLTEMIEHCLSRATTHSSQVQMKYSLVRFILGHKTHE